MNLTNTQRYNDLMNRHSELCQLADRAAEAEQPRSVAVPEGGQERLMSRRCRAYVARELSIRVSRNMGR